MVCSSGLFGLSPLFSKEDHNDDWFLEAKKYYYDYNVAIEEYKNKNYINAYKLLSTLAKEGDPRAQSDIAGMYFNGWGVVKNFKMAFKWYKKSSLNGNPYAQYKLGDMYWNGFGVDFGGIFGVLESLGEFCSHNLLETSWTRDGAVLGQFCSMKDQKLER